MLNRTTCEWALRHWLHKFVYNCHRNLWLIWIFVLGSNTVFKKGFLGCIVGLILLYVNADTPKPIITQVFEKTCCPCLLLKIVYKDTKTLQLYTNRNYLQTLLKIHRYDSLCLRKLSFTNRASKANVVKWKVSKKGIKKFHLSVYEWKGICMSIHMSVCLSVCLSVRIKKLNNFWLNERILMKFSGPVQLLTSNFWLGGVRSAGLKGMALDQKQLVSRKSIFSLIFCPTGVWHTFLETLGPGLKSPRSKILNFGVGPKILGPEWEGTCQCFCGI